MKKEAVVIEEKEKRSGEIKNIPPSMIQIKTANVRESYDPEKRATLKESIREHGVLEPIHVRKNGSIYELTHGFTRFAIVNELIAEGCEIKYIKAISSQVSEEDELLRHLLLNSGEPLTKFEISKVFKQLKNFGNSNKEISIKTGYSEVEVSKLINFQDQASTEIKNAVKNGELDITPAISLIREAKTNSEQNSILKEAKEKASKENRTKITNKDVLKKGLRIQDKFEMFIHLFSESNNTDLNLNEKIEFAKSLFEMLGDSKFEAGDILEKITK